MTFPDFDGVSARHKPSGFKEEPKYGCKVCGVFKHRLAKENCPCCNDCHPKHDEEPKQGASSLWSVECTVGDCPNGIDGRHLVRPGCSEPDFKQVCDSLSAARGLVYGFGVVVGTVLIALVVWVILK